MPFLAAPEEESFFTIPPQKAKFAGETDVLVVGGGPSGIGAAYGAAKSGVDVVLVERYGFLGGNATVALVMPLMTFYKEFRHLPEGGKRGFHLIPTDHGPGEAVIAGVLRDFLQLLADNGGLISPSRKTGFVVPFDPEVFKMTALELLDRSGINILFHAYATAVFQNNGKNQVIFQSKSGPIMIQAKKVIDCTGDGDIAFMAGADYELGREDDHLFQPMTLMFRMGQFSPALFQEYVKKNPDQWLGVHGLWDLIEEAKNNGELELAREDMLFFATPHEKEVSVNATRVTGTSGVNVWDLTKAEFESRKQMRSIVAFMKKYVPGFADSYAIQSGVQIGVRETRRICGLYRLTEEDVLTARKFRDCIARNTYPIDIHNPKGKGTVMKRLPLGESYDIPLRSLIPRNVEHIIVAGRCISGSHEALASYRIMPACMATGQAAGVCAALAVKNEKFFRDIDYKNVQKDLITQGANLILS